MVLYGFERISKNPVKYGSELYSTGFRRINRGAQEGHLHPMFYKACKGACAIYVPRN